ncbi:MAG: M24 family metallopeptidase [Bacteroidota bacterium]
MINDLIIAEKKAAQLFAEAENRHFFKAGQTEKELNTKLFQLAEEMFGIRKYWHKRIVRSGTNTLLPYKENPPDLLIKSDDILFIDFGPVFEEWEADFGRTYVIGNDPYKTKLKQDVETAWHIGHKYFQQNYLSLTGANLYHYTQHLATSFGWEYGNAHCGHLIGNFPHEEILGEEEVNYLHPNNNILLSASDKLGNKRYWIYEIHFVDKAKQIGAFFEQLVSE